MKGKSGELPDGAQLKTPSKNCSPPMTMIELVEALTSHHKRSCEIEPIVGVLVEFFRGGEDMEPVIGICNERDRSTNGNIESRYVSGDKNMVTLKVAILAAFCFIGTGSCPERRTRTCTDCRIRQEHEPIPD